MWPDDNGGWSGVGPAEDGTYSVPGTAQPVNSPANTAGFPSLNSDSALDLLKYGVGIVTDSWKFKELMDYRRFEATNGGVFQQGRTATSSAATAGALPVNGLILAALAVAGFLLLTRKG
jgi:hypothetical protein